MCVCVCVSVCTFYDKSYKNFQFPFFSLSNYAFYDGNQIKFYFYTFFPCPPERRVNEQYNFSHNFLFYCLSYHLF